MKKITALLAATAVLALPAAAQAFAYFRSATTVAHGPSSYYPRATYHVAGSVSAVYTYHISGRVYDRSTGTFLPDVTYSSSFHFNSSTRDINADFYVDNGTNHSPCFYLVSGHSYDLESAMKNEQTGDVYGPDSSLNFTKSGVCP